MASWNQLSREHARAMLFLMIFMFEFLAACILGSFGIVDLQILQQYGASHTAAVDVSVMVASFLLITVADIGCIGVIEKSLKCLHMFVGLIMILVVLEMVIFIFVAQQRDGWQFRITKWIRQDFLRSVTGEDRSMHKRSWDELQIDFRCCGLNGPGDYLAEQQPISLSCCPRAYCARNASAQQELYRICIENAGYYTKGCADQILDMLGSNADWLLEAVIVTFWLQGACMLLALWLANNIKNSVTVHIDTVRY